MSAPLRNIARASRSKNILNSVRSYSTKEPVCTIILINYSPLISNNLLTNFNFFIIIDLKRTFC